MNQLQSIDKSVSNIEKIMKYCSKLGDIIKYPYFFNWSTSTNHRDLSPEGFLTDTYYFLFRAGRYPQHPEVSMICPVEMILLHAPVDIILRHTAFQSFMDDIGPFGENKGIILKSFEDIETHKDLIKSGIDKCLKADIIRETNRAIDLYNEQYPNQKPVTHINNVTDKKN